jgi:hypothetical protein
MVAPVQAPSEITKIQPLEGKPIAALPEAVRNNIANNNVRQALDDLRDLKKMIAELPEGSISAITFVLRSGTFEVSTKKDAMEKCKELEAEVRSPQEKPAGFESVEQNASGGFEYRVANAPQNAQIRLIDPAGEEQGCTLTSDGLLEESGAKNGIYTVIFIDVEGREQQMHVLVERGGDATSAVQQVPAMQEVQVTQEMVDAALAAEPKKFMVSGQEVEMVPIAAEGASYYVEKAKLEAYQNAQDDGARAGAYAELAQGAYLVKQGEATLVGEDQITEVLLRLFYTSPDGEFNGGIKNPKLTGYKNNTGKSDENHVRDAMEQAKGIIESLRQARGEGGSVSHEEEAAIYFAATILGYYGNAQKFATEYLGNKEKGEGIKEQMKSFLDSLGVSKGLEYTSNNTVITTGLLVQKPETLEPANVKLAMPAPAARVAAETVAASENVAAQSQTDAAASVLTIEQMADNAVRELRLPEEWKGKAGSEFAKSEVRQAIEGVVEADRQNAITNMAHEFAARTVVGAVAPELGTEAESQIKQKNEGNLGAQQVQPSVFFQLLYEAWAQRNMSAEDVSKLSKSQVQEDMKAVAGTLGFELREPASAAEPSAAQINPLKSDRELDEMPIQ